MLNKGIDLNQENTLACRTGPVSFFTGTGGGGIFSRSSSSLPHIRPTDTHTTLTKFQLISNASYHVWEDLPQLSTIDVDKIPKPKTQKKNTQVFLVFLPPLFNRGPVTLWHILCRSYVLRDGRRISPVGELILRGSGRVGPLETSLPSTIFQGRTVQLGGG